MVTLESNFLFNDGPFEMTPLTLARHLGRVVRFGGTVDHYWTVLQHSLLVHAILQHQAFPGDQDRVSLLGLLHDAHEMITGDWPTPWKTDEVRRIQAGVDRKIADAWGLPGWTPQEHEAVARADKIALALEGHLIAPRVVSLKPDAFLPFAEVKQHEDLVWDYCAQHPVADFLDCWSIDGRHVHNFSRAVTDRLVRLRSRVADV